VPSWHALGDQAAATYVAVARGGRLYVVTMGAGPCHLHALDRAGNELWCSDAVQAAWTAPAVTDDGGIVVADDAHLRRFAPDGALRWETPIATGAVGVTFTSSGRGALDDGRSGELADAQLARVDAALIRAADDGELRRSKALEARVLVRVTRLLVAKTVDRAPVRPDDPRLTAAGGLLDRVAGLTTPPPS
jgi:hypothetical protein